MPTMASTRRNTVSRPLTWGKWIWRSLIFSPLEVIAVTTERCRSRETFEHQRRLEATANCRDLGRLAGIAGTAAKCVVKQAHGVHDIFANALSPGAAPSVGVHQAQFKVHTAATHDQVFFVQ